MNFIEVARQVASELHIQALNNGIDPWKPYDFAKAEAERQNIDVEPVIRGATILNGSKAVYRSDECLIYHENSGSLFEQAFLVAHELGHAILEENIEIAEIKETEFTRSSEPSPIGLNRIVDYGHKQRNEVKMDLFAREFLLPRSVVKKLYSDEKMTALEIANKLGAPYGVVIQQLMDAILLPLPNLSKDHPPKNYDLNDKQKEAVLHRGCSFLLEAGPGTGKTQTLISRIESLLKEGISASEILVLTFSNKAANEIIERISIKNKEAASLMWIGTFHAFGLDLIRRFYDNLGFISTPELLENTEAVEFIENEYLSLKLKHYRELYDPSLIINDLLSVISRAKDEVVNEKSYQELAIKMRNLAQDEEEIVTGDKILEISKLYTHYEKIKKNRNFVDFGDLILLPVLLLENEKDINIHIQNQYKHVLVDEYQDVNHASVRLLKALKPDGNNLWLVGDARQSIYRFRGASPFNITRFGIEDFKEGIRKKLEINYRSNNEIVSTFSDFAKKMESINDNFELKSNIGSVNCKPTHFSFDDASIQPIAIAEAINNMKSKNFNYNEQAVLCSGNTNLSTIANELEKLGIPVLYLGNIFERSEIKDLLSFLLLLSEKQATGLIRISCISGFEMDFEDVNTVLNYVKENDKSFVNIITESKSIPNVSDEGNKVLLKLSKIFEGFNYTSSPWTVLTTLLFDRTDIIRNNINSDNFSHKNKFIAIWQFLNFVYAQPLKYVRTIHNFLERVRKLVRLSGEKELRQLPLSAQNLNAVRLITMHGAKGLEFPVIHLPNINADTIPNKRPQKNYPFPIGLINGLDSDLTHYFREQQYYEQECLFYVALSRAKDKLFIYTPIKNSNGHKRSISPFLERISDHFESKFFTSSKKIINSNNDKIKYFKLDNITFKASQIARYEICPRQFFYSSIMKISERKVETVFSQLHKVVNFIYKNIITQKDFSIDSESILEKINLEFKKLDFYKNEYIDDYKEFAFSMVHYFLTMREGFNFKEPVFLKISFDNEEILVQPDEILIHQDGSHILRKIKTGHYKSKDEESITSAAFLEVARKTFSNARVELVYLSDQKISEISLTSKKIDNRIKKIKDYLNDIKNGNFPTNISSRVCPNCLAYFVCNNIPQKN